MALSYPLTFPTTKVAVDISLSANSRVGESHSPFTEESQVYAHAGMLFAAAVSLPPMVRADAEDYVAFLLGLNGVEGTFLMAGDPINTSPRGTWAGSPKVLNAHAAGVRSITMDGFTAGATVKNGDWFQSGTGSSSRLHKVVKDATADGAGLLTLEVWPSTRAALADNDTFTTASPKGVWRLASNERRWDIGRAQKYGISFNCREAL
jgi:hypothetical protein